MRTNDKPSELKVDQLVTTDFTFAFSKVVRRITDIQADSNYGSGFRATADGGKPCECCGHRPTIAIANVDAAWFIPVNQT